MHATGEEGPGGRNGRTILEAGVLAAVAKAEVAVSSMGSHHCVTIVVWLWPELASAYLFMVVVHGL